MRKLIVATLLALAGVNANAINDSAVTTASSVGTNDLVAVNLVGGHSRRISAWNFLESLKLLGNWPIGGGGSGGGGLSNSIPTTATYTGTNIFCNASAANFFDITVTNNFILNVTNAATPGFANGESRRIRLRRNGSGQWAGYATNSAVHFGSGVTAIDFGSPPGGNVSNAVTYLVLVWDSSNSRWDAVGNSGGY